VDQKDFKHHFDAQVNQLWWKLLRYFRSP